MILYVNSEKYLKENMRALCWAPNAKPPGMGGGVNSGADPNFEKMGGVVPLQNEFSSIIWASPPPKSMPKSNEVL